MSHSFSDYDHAGLRHDYNFRTYIEAFNYCCCVIDGRLNDEVKTDFNFKYIAIPFLDFQLIYFLRLRLTG